MKNSIYPILIILIAFLMNACEIDDTKPTLVTTDNFSITIPDNIVNGDTIGIVPGTSNKGSVIFRIIEQIPEGAFTVDSNYGELVVADEDKVKFDLNPQITLTVEISKEEVTEISEVTIDLLKCALSNDWPGENWLGDLTVTPTQFFPGFPPPNAATGKTGCDALIIEGANFLSIIDFFNPCNDNTMLALRFIPSESDPNIGALEIDLEQSSITCNARTFIAESGEVGTYNVNIGELTFSLFDAEANLPFPVPIGSGVPFTVTKN